MAVVRKSGIQSAKFNRACELTAMDEIKNHYSGRYLGLRERHNWEFVTRTNASSVAILVPVTDNNEIVLVEQFRVPVDCRVIELAAGLVGDLNDPQEAVMSAAHRELEEETGFQAGQLSHLLTCPSSPGMSDEIVSFFLAEDLLRVSAGGGDASENIKVHIVPLATADDWLVNMMKTGVLIDPKIYSALYWLQRRAQGLAPLPV